MKKLTILLIFLLTITTCSTTVFAAANLTVSNSVYNSTPLYGAENYQYTAVKNTGSDAATNVQVTNTYSPSKYNTIEWWVSWDNQATYIKNDSSYNPTTGIWTIGDLASGKKVYLDIRFLTNSTGTTTSTATATATNANTVSKSFTVTPTTSSTTNNLALTSVFGSTTPSAGSSNTLTITVSRDLFTTATGVILNDGLPAGLNIASWRVRSQTWFLGYSWGSWTSNPTSYDPWTGIWQFTLETLNTAQQLEITFTTPTTAGTTQVISTVYGNQRDTNLANNYNAAYFTVPSTLRALSLSTLSAFSTTELGSDTSTGSSSNTGSTINSDSGSGTSGSGSSINLPTTNSLLGNNGSQTTGIAEILSNLLNILLSTVSSAISSTLTFIS